MDRDNNFQKGPRRVSRQYYCSIEVAIDCISGKWKPRLIYYLKSGPKRFTALQKLIPRASKKVIAAQLKDLEADGVIVRNALEDITNGVEYRLAESSGELLSALQALHEWGMKQAHLKNIRLELATATGEIN